MKGEGNAMNRRRWLGLSAAALGGLWGTSWLTAGEASAAEGGLAPVRRCILLWMNGGPSHIDTFDPKPGSRAAGPLGAIATSMPGVQLSETLPQLAEIANRLTIVRGMTSREGNHQRARKLMHTGYVDNPTVDHPSLGAWVSHELGAAASDLPAHIAIHGPGFGAGFLGASHGPFSVAKAGRLPDAATPHAAIGDARFERRQRALAELERRFAGRTKSPLVDERRSVYQRAIGMMHSKHLDAFDLSGEPQSLLDAYGDSDFGRGCLTARRLVGRGVPFVEVVLDGWDTHRDNFTRTQKLCDVLDPAMATLTADLEQRGMRDDTLVIWMGEFGRGPQISGDEGRNHHPAAWTAVLCGGGARPSVHGVTDDVGARVTRDAVTVPDLFATVTTLLGMDPDKTLDSDLGRPISITDGGVPVAGLMRNLKPRHDLGPRAKPA